MQSCFVCICFSLWIPAELRSLKLSLLSFEKLAWKGGAPRASSLPQAHEHKLQLIKTASISPGGRGGEMCVLILSVKGGNPGPADKEMKQVEQISINKSFFVILITGSVVAQMKGLAINL